MSIVTKVEDFFKNLGTHIKSAFVALFGAQAGTELANAAETWAKTELGKMAITVVQGLEAAAISPADKQKQALLQIGQQLAAQGKSLPTSAINFAIELSLQIIRGAVASKS